MAPSIYMSFASYVVDTIYHFTKGPKPFILYENREQVFERYESYEHCFGLICNALKNVVLNVFLKILIILKEKKINRFQQITVPGS